MKNKKILYVLGLLTMVVWGLILQKTISSLADQKHPIISGSYSASKEPFNDYSIKETKQLNLQYRDPFGIVKILQPFEAIKPLKKRLNVTTASTLPPNHWENIRYAGYIFNPISKKTISMLNINGKHYMLGEGDSEEQFKLIKNMRDSIKGLYKGQIGFIEVYTPDL